MADLFTTLNDRGLLYDASRGCADYLRDEDAPQGYVGFDPTASSLHVGSLLPIMGLVRLQRGGGRPIAVVGGGTGMIGDPSGRSAERKFLTVEELEHNLAGIRRQLEQFLDFDGPRGARLVNNLDWLGSLNFMEFLRDIGKHVSVNHMLAKDSVKLRLDRAREGAEGISYTEFTYMLLQAYDFLHLFDQTGCRFQFGGSDQWGNITAGIDLIGRLRSEQAYGLVMPLITTASGQKFGKSEGANIWLAADRTSPYRFYQYWINCDDADVSKYLNYFTHFTTEQIGEIQTEHARAPERRLGQRTLAAEITRTVHGDEGVARAETASQALFGGDLDVLTAQELADVFGDVPSLALDPHAALPTIIDLFVASGLAKSRGEARRLASGGGVYLNNHRISEPEQTIERSRRLAGRYLVLRKGAKSYALIDWPD